MSTESSESVDRTETHVEEVSEEALGSQSSQSQTSPVKIAIIVGLGAVAIYLATWLGPLAFHLQFQGRMVAAKNEMPGLVVWTRPDEVPAVVLPTCGLSHRVENGIMIIGRLPGGK